MAADEVVGAAVGSGGADVAGVGVEVQPPAVFVDEAVVESAEQDQVGQAGRAAVGPMGEVVAVAPGRGPVAPGESAVLSRSSTARRSAVGTTRLSRPMSRGWLREPSTTGMMPASQASRRAVSAQIGSPGWRSRAGPPGRSGSPRPASTSLMRSACHRRRRRRCWRSEPPRPRHPPPVAPPPGVLPRRGVVAVCAGRPRPRRRCRRRCLVGSPASACRSGVGWGLAGWGR